jgi:transposase
LEAAKQKLRTDAKKGPPPRPQKERRRRARDSAWRVGRVHFFASRLKYSRDIRVSLVPNQTVEPLVRTLAGHLQDWGGRPLLCVFDRPKTIALKWKKNGEVTEWNPVFAEATLEMGIGVELCWPYQARQKGLNSYCTS